MVELTVHTTIPDTRIIVATSENVLRYIPYLSSYARSEGAAETLAPIVAESREAWIIELHGIPALVIGIMAPSLISTEGTVWMVRLQGYGIAATRRLRALHRALTERYDRVNGFVETSNGEAERLVRWLGGELHEQHEHNGRQYQRFVMRAG